MFDFISASLVFVLIGSLTLHLCAEGTQVTAAQRFMTIGYAHVIPSEQITLHIGSASLAGVASLDDVAAFVSVVADEDQEGVTTWPSACGSLDLDAKTLTIKLVGSGIMGKFTYQVQWMIIRVGTFFAGSNRDKIIQVGKARTRNRDTNEVSFANARNNYNASLFPNPPVVIVQSASAAISSPVVSLISVSKDAFTLSSHGSDLEVSYMAVTNGWNIRIEEDLYFNALAVEEVATNRVGPILTNRLECGLPVTFGTVVGTLEINNTVCLSSVSATTKPNASAAYVSWVKSGSFAPYNGGFKVTVNLISISAAAQCCFYTLSGVGLQDAQATAPDGSTTTPTSSPKTLALVISLSIAGVGVVGAVLYWCMRPRSPETGDAVSFG